MSTRLGYRIHQALRRSSSDLQRRVPARRSLRVAAILMTIALAACGNGASANHQAQKTSAAGQPAPVDSTHTCSQFCLQAGPEGGPNSDGCQGPDGKPYSSSTANGCLECPAQDCLDVLSATATPVNGTVAVRLRCRVSIPCDGALLLLEPNRQVAPDGNKLPPSEWVGGSDIRVQAGAVANVGITLTQLGKQLVSSPGGYTAAVAVQIRVYGSVGYHLQGPGPMILIRG
jgi:hypothetical protein